MPMDELTRAMLDSIRATVDELKGMVQRILDREENRQSRMNETEKAIALIEADCRSCRERSKEDRDAGHNKIRDVEKRLDDLEDPEKGAVRKGAGDKRLNRALVILSIVSVSISVIAGAYTALSSIQRGGTQSPVYYYRGAVSTNAQPFGKLQRLP